MPQPHRVRGGGALLGAVRSWTYSAIVTALVTFCLGWAGAAAAQPGSMLRLEGRVLDAAGPFEGAAVELRRTPGAFQLRDGALGEDPDGKAAGDLVDEAVTDADGVYRLRADGPGLYRVIVSAEGRASQQKDLEPLVSSHTLAAVTLPRSLELTVEVGGVESTSRKPVAGALVLVEAPRLGSPGEWFPRTRLARTDADGRVRLDWPVAAGRRWR